MGSIIYIEKNPNKWRVIDDGLRLKSNPSETLVKVIYGDFDDDPLGSCDLEMLMRKSVYDKLLSSVYRMDSNNRRELVILDRDGKPVSPIETDVIY